MGSLQLHQEELVISSENVRCFFYMFRLPLAWFPSLGFGKPVPLDLVPPGGWGGVLSDSIGGRHGTESRRVPGLRLPSKGLA